LNNYLPSDYLNMFNSKIISDMCTYNNKIFSLPIFFSYDILYANKALLNKYEKKIPKTWSELLETARYILEQEELVGNKELIGYNGLLSDDDDGSCSIYEYIYSFRDTYYDKFPGFSSSNASNALQYLKRMKSEIASDEIFMSDGEFIIEKLLSKNVLFAKYKNIYDKPDIDTNYYKVSLPGNMEGVSSSYINGQYLAIPNSISGENMKAAVLALQYLTSKEVQKKILIENKSLYPTIPLLLYDEEVCLEFDCELLKNIQPVLIPNRSDYDTYTFNLRGTLYGYIYGNMDVNTALQNFENYINNSNTIDDSNLNSPDDYYYYDDDDDDSIFDMKYVSDECKAVIDKTMKCLQKIESEFNAKVEYFENLKFETVCLPSNKDTNAENCKTIVKQSLDTVCKLFDDDDCKDFIAEDNVVNLINSSKCESEYDDISILGEIASAKSIYLMGCKKSETGNLCPLGKYATSTAVDFFFENFETLEKLGEQRYDINNNNDFEAALDLGNDVLTLAPVLVDLNNILVDSCSDAACNKNIIALDKMILAAKAAYEKNQKVDLTKKFPKVFETYDSYLDNYRNKKCKMINFAADDDDGDGNGATSFKKISYSLVIMVVASILLLL